MQKKEDKTKGNKESHRYNWTPLIIIIITFAVILVIFTNDFSSSTGSAVRGGGSKKPDLVPYGADLQTLDYTGFRDNTTLLANIQEGVGVGNIGDLRAKESVLAAGMQGNSVEGVTASAFILDVTGTYRSAQTKFYSIDNWFQSSIEIGVNPLQPGTGTGYTILFMHLPIKLPPLNGTTPVETNFTLYGIADASSVISESNENNNKLNRSYIVHCVRDNTPPNYFFCCVKRVDPLSTRYVGIRYCEDYGIR